MTRRFGVAVLATTVVLALVWVVGLAATPDPSADIGAPGARAERAIPQSSTGGGVDVTVTRREPEAGQGDPAQGPVAFEVTMNTHSVELADDLTTVAVLRCDLGGEYRPVAWDGAPPGGHHRQGVLRFAALDHPVGSLELVIRGVGGVPERGFRWEASPAV